MRMVKAGRTNEPCIHLTIYAQAQNREHVILKKTAKPQMQRQLGHYFLSSNSNFPRKHSMNSPKKIAPRGYCGAPQEPPSLARY